MYESIYHPITVHNIRIVEMPKFSLLKNRSFQVSFNKFSTQTRKTVIHTVIHTMKIMKLLGTLMTKETSTGVHLKLNS
jgi:hypothetical protein